MGQGHRVPRPVRLELDEVRRPVVLEPGDGATRGEEADVYRSSGRWVEIFQEAGLKIVKEEVQEGLPEELFTVKT